jgi:hypothetical protein
LRIIVILRKEFEEREVMKKMVAIKESRET